MFKLARGARRVFALLLVASVMLGVFFSGRSYFFCVAVQQVDEDACACVRIRNTFGRMYAVGKTKRTGLS